MSNDAVFLELVGQFGKLAGEFLEVTLPLNDLVEAHALRALPVLPLNGKVAGFGGGGYRFDGLLFHAFSVAGLAGEVKPAAAF